ncbi:amino acid ABC transporter substrate-binding protein [Segeticoccus rhizosphaerae]|uniref:amino acid ABC transporter substrate-binding protein n=1 Tax=Segeticoccus rhizosphaerae TaxID=1104777 RepID=UPI0010BF95D5|nr:MULTISPECIES: amino acid ABC transporter substrate-binding protein [Intrasporangiaceae]
MSTPVTRRQFMVRFGALAGGAVLAPSVLSACGGGSGGGGGSDTFKIGAVLELSGESATGGQVAKRGYQLWADTVNKAGGIEVGGKKYKVELKIQDCQSQPSVGAQAAERLASQEGVDAMFGSYTSGVQIAMNPICAKYKVPCIAGSAESPANWKDQPQFTYGIIPAVDLTAAKAVQAIVDSASSKPTTAAVIGVNEPFSDDTALGFQQGVKQSGLQEVHYSLFPANADLAPIASVVADKNPDIVAVGGHDVMLVDVVKALKAARFTPKAIIEHYGITDASFAKALGKDADGVLGISVWLPDAPLEDKVFGKASEYAAAFKKAYGSEPDYTAAGCSTAGEVLQLALQQLGEAPSLSEDAKVKLNGILAKTDIKTFYGQVKFAQDGDHFHDNTALSPILVQIQDGKVVAVDPPDASNSKMIYPLKSWAKR